MQESYSLGFAEGLASCLERDETSIFLDFAHVQAHTFNMRHNETLSVEHEGILTRNMPDTGILSIPKKLTLGVRNVINDVIGSKTLQNTLNTVI